MFYSQENPFYGTIKVKYKVRTENNWHDCEDDLEVEDILDDGWDGSKLSEYKIVSQIHDMDLVQTNNKLFFSKDKIEQLQLVSVETLEEEECAPQD